MAPVTAAPRTGPVVVTPPMRLRARALVISGVMVLAAGVLVVSELADSSRREGATVIIGSAFILLQLVNLVRTTRLVRAGRATQQRAQEVVGTGPGPIVHLVPVWTASPMPLHVELWPVDGGPPLGRVALARVDRGFDPTVPFHAWGGPDPGDVALTSVDGRQLVLPTSRLDDVGSAPAVDPSVTAAARRLLRWPPIDRVEDGPALSPVDAAVDAYRARLRWATPATIACVAVIALALPVATFVAGTRGFGGGVAAIVLAIAVIVALHRCTQAPMRDLVDPVTRGGGPSPAKVIAAVAQARWVPAGG